MNSKKTEIISMIALINVIFVPIFDVWGGLFPSDPDGNFFYVVEALFNDPEAFFEWVVMFTAAAFIPGVLMLIFSVSNNKTGVKVCAGLGIVLIVLLLLSHTSQNGTESLSPEDGNIAIGTWIALVLFVAALVVSFQEKTNARNIGGYTGVTSNSQVQASQHGYPIQVNFCEKCGAKVKNGERFCKNCGAKL